MAAVVACGCGPSTFVDVRFDADADLAERARRLELRVRDEAGRVVFEQARSVGLGAAPLPVAIRLAQGGDGENAFFLEAILRGAETEELGRIEARAAYLPGVPARLDLRFQSGCAAAACAEGLTCHGGECVGACYAARPATEAAEAATPVSCVRAPPVYVHPADGRDHPEACTDPASPCASLTYAVDRYVERGEGTVIHARGGLVHRGPLTLTAAHSGSPAAPTVIRAWPEGSRPVLSGDGVGPAARFCCDDSAPHDVRLEGFQIVETAGAGVSVSGAGARRVVLSDLHVEPVGRADDSPLVIGIQVERGAAEVSVEGCVIDGGDDDQLRIGLSATDTEATIFERNDVIGETEIGVELLAGRGVLVRGNRIDDAYTGLEVRGTAHRIVDNWICDARVGLEVDLSEGMVVEHNSFVDSHRGASFGGRAVGGSFRSNIVAFIQSRALSLPWSFERIELRESHNLYYEIGSFFPDELEPTEAIVGRDPLFRAVDACDLVLEPSSPARGAAHDGEDIGAR